MQFSLTVTDPDLIAGITAAMNDRNAALPQTIEVDGVEVPNPELLADVVEYFRINAITWLQRYAMQHVPGYVLPVTTVPHEPTEAEQVAMASSAVQYRLDTFFQERRYDGVLSAASYVNDPNPQFAAEGMYAVTVRSATWAKCYEILGAVMQGARPMPTLAELMAELPVLAWPEL